MRGFAERVGSENAIAFANAVISSDQLGSPLAGILRAQAADFRHRRQMLAEERAQKAPVKMLFPIAIFVLPVMFVVILAPAFLGGRACSDVPGSVLRARTTFVGRSSQPR